MSFVVSLGSCWGFSSQLVQCLARSLSHQKLEIPIKWSQLDCNQVETDLVSWETFLVYFILGLSRYKLCSSYAATFHTYVEIPMKFSRVDQNYVEPDFVSLKTFCLSHCKIDMGFVANLVSCWGFSRQLGHRLGRSSHQELVEIPMKWSQLD
jgi:hypothetical protein